MDPDGQDLDQNGNDLSVTWILESLDKKSELELILKIKVLKSLNQDSKAQLGEHKFKTKQGIFLKSVRFL